MIAMGIDITQWRIEIAKYWRYAGRRRHSRRKTQGVKTASLTSCNPLLAMIVSVARNRKIFRALRGNTFSCYAASDTTPDGYSTSGELPTALSDAHI